MKQLILSFTLLALLIAVACYCDRYMLDTADSMLASLESMRQHQEAEDFEQAAKDAEELQRKWEQCSTGWHTLVMHHELNELEKTLARTLSFQRTQDLQFHAEAEALKTIIWHVPRKQIILWENIL